MNALPRRMAGERQKHMVTYRGIIVFIVKVSSKAAGGKVSLSDYKGQK